MSMPPLAELDELLQRLLDHQIRPEEMERLQRALREDRRVRDYYIDSMLACAVIRRSSQVTGELSKADLIRALSDGESPGRTRRGVRRVCSIAAALILGALVLVSLSMWFRGEPGPVVGSLAGAYEARWEGARPRPGEPLTVGSYDLREGVAKMELGQGTSLLLEAPCRVELKGAAEVALTRGWLAAAVSPETRGFRVHTPTALITDLGTEFGVVAHADGSTEAHVLKGRIGVALDPNRSGRPASLVVNEGLAAAVDADGRTLQGGLVAQAGLFLLQIPSPSQPASPGTRLNLADVVGGGNGRGTGTLDRGIDLGTGRAYNSPATDIRWIRRNEFKTLPQFRGVDGVFVPNGANGPVVISYTGLVFSECPGTTGSYYGGPTNSGKFLDLLGQEVHTARLYGVRFGTPAHPALNLHPNAGITFDLDPLRLDHPDIRMDRFTAVCGIPKDLPRAQWSSAEVWVLLDGVVRLRLHYPAERNGVQKVDVPIPARTRFLTLVATCSGRADYAWVFFGDPFLGPAAPARVEGVP